MHDNQLTLIYKCLEFFLGYLSYLQVPKIMVNVCVCGGGEEGLIRDPVGGRVGLGTRRMGTGGNLRVTP